MATKSRKIRARSETLLKAMRKMGFNHPASVITVLTENGDWQRDLIKVARGVDRPLSLLVLLAGDRKGVKGEREQRRKD